jgi:LysM repeat protein
MQITHEEARRLIQYKIDAELNPQQKEILSTHLKNCVECQVYAKDIKEVESILVPVLKRHWNLRPIPLSAHSIASTKNSKTQANTLLATRTAMIGFVFMAVALTFCQFILPSRSAFSQLSTSVLPVPTPSTQSTQSTSTSIQFQNCEVIIYKIQENDILESIADQFSVAKEEIMAINHLKIETVDNTMELLIPICDSTPTGTVHPTTLTTTHTPAIRQNTSIPGG